MFRIAVIVSLVCMVSCAAKESSSDGELSKLREDIAEVHKDLRDLRDEQRALRAELRELRGDPDIKSTAQDPPDTKTPESANDAGTVTVTNTAEKKPAITSSPARQATVQISITSNPAGAKVYIKGKVMGRTPVLIKSVPSSDAIDIRVEKEGYRARILTVRPEEDTKLSVQLAKK